MNRKFLLSLICLCNLLLAACVGNDANISETVSPAYQGKSATELYQMGTESYNKKNYNDAVKAFEAASILYPASRYAERTQLKLGWSYFQNGDYPLAEGAADRFLREYPSSSFADEALYLKGLSEFTRPRSFVMRYLPTDDALRDNEKAEAAFQSFSTLTTQFPQSKYAQDARKRMVYLRNQFAKHELEIANFYMARAAYVAASNRASAIVETYPGTPEVKPALILLHTAYEKLHLADRAAAIAGIIRKNYPDVKV